MITFLGIIILLIVGTLGLIWIISKDNAQLEEAKSCEDCKHFWDDCVGSFNGTCGKFQRK